jgi:hypothetical protein
MGFGLLILVSVGKENIYLSSQPEITYFKIAYKRYTNFSIETVAQYFINTPDFGRRVTVNISKNADLLGQIYIFIVLPDIVRSSNNIKQFAWIKKIGLGIIKQIDLEIGGVIIETNYTNWLNIWYELTISYGKKKAYNKMIGNIELLTKFSNGKKSFGLNIPLNFWFCQHSGLALPLCSMIHNDIKIHIQFNNFKNTYLESPTNYITINESFCLFEEGELIKQNVNGNIAVGKFVYYDNINQYIYYNKLINDFIVPLNLDSKYIIYGINSGFEINIKPNSLLIIDESYFNFNTPSLIDAYLLVNYIYLDNDERFIFINKDHQYLIPIVQNISQQTYSSSNIAYKIPFSNPNKIIFWVAQLYSNIILNDIFNYTLYPLSDTYDNIIQSENIILNSIERMEINLVEMYTHLQIYLNKFISLSIENQGINMFSLSLDPYSYQPSGSLNFSEIDDAYIQMKVSNKINYQNKIIINGYGLQYNLLRVSDGLCALTFYS